MSALFTAMTCMDDSIKENNKKKKIVVLADVELKQTRGTV